MMEKKLIGLYGLLVLGLFALVLVTVQVAVPVYLGQTGIVVDSPKPTAKDLAELVTDTTQYLVTLATGVLALVGLLLTEQFGSLRSLLTPPWRHAIAVGAIFCVLSLLSGFITFQMIVHASADAVVRGNLEGVLWLHFLQFGNLGIGVLLIGVAVLWHGIVQLSR